MQVEKKSVEVEVELEAKVDDEGMRLVRRTLRKEWDVRKMENSRLVELYEKARLIDENVITSKRLEDLRNCGVYLKLVRLVDSEGKRKCKVERATFCRWRLCPICQWRRALKLYAQMRDVLAVLISRRPTLRYLFVTLTVRNCEVGELGGKLDELNAAFLRLMKVRELRFRVKGWIRATEVTLSKSRRDVHPHFHILVAVDAEYFGGSYIPQAKWRELWQKALKVDYNPVVNVQAVKRGDSAHTLREISGAFKYAAGGTKGAPGNVRRLFEMWEDGVEEFPLDMLIGLTRELRNRRFIAFSGVFKDTRRELGQTDSEDLSDANEIKAAKLADLVEGYTRVRFDIKSGVYEEI